MFMLYDDYHHKILCVVCAFFHPSLSRSLFSFSCEWNVDVFEKRCEQTKVNIFPQQRRFVRASLLLLLLLRLVLIECSQFLIYPMHTQAHTHTDQYSVILLYGEFIRSILWACVCLSVCTVVAVKHLVNRSGSLDSIQIICFVCSLKWKRPEQYTSIEINRLKRTRLLCVYRGLQTTAKSNNYNYAGKNYRNPGQINRKYCGK